MSRRELGALIRATAGRRGLAELSRQWGMTPQRLCDVLHGRCRVPPQVLRPLRLREVVEYVPLPDDVLRSKDA